jgi:hypothetical protein
VLSCPDPLCANRDGTRRLAGRARAAQRSAVLIGNPIAWAGGASDTELAILCPSPAAQRPGNARICRNEVVAVARVYAQTCIIFHDSASTFTSLQQLLRNLLRRRIEPCRLGAICRCHSCQDGQHRISCSECARQRDGYSRCVTQRLIAAVRPRRDLKIVDLPAAGCLTWHDS